MPRNDDPPHLSPDLLRLAARGLVPREPLVLGSHQHLLKTCPRCREEHTVDMELLGERRDGPPALGGTRSSTASTAPGQPPPLPGDHRHVGAPDLTARLPLLAEIQRLRDLDRRHLQVLLELPPERWEEEVAAARSRFRNRSFAERLLEESRLRVRREPELARRLAVLVPVVLRWLSGAEGTPWAAELRARAVAWEANALRVAGDLTGAEERFAGLGGTRWIPAHCWAGAEIASLRASLRIDQGRYDEAADLLASARRVFEQLDDREATIRTMIKQGNLLATMLHTAEALGCYEEAAQRATGWKSLRDYAATLAAGRVFTLCDLERYREARDVLAAQGPLSKIADPHLQAVLRYNRGRIAVAEERPGEALPDLTAARDAFLEGGRIYDAALASLDLAYALLQAGRAAEARDLAADLVPQFEARGVARQTLAALTVLAEAVAAERVSRNLLAGLRRRLGGPARDSLGRPRA